jgi:hypothetical protein
MDCSIIHYNTMDYGYIMEIYHGYVPLAPAQQVQPDLGAQPQCGEDVWGRFQNSSHLAGREAASRAAIWTGKWGWPMNGDEWW